MPPSPKGTLVQRSVAALSRVAGSLHSAMRPGLRILMYHGVGTDVPRDRYGMSVAADAFANQIRWLRDEGVRIVSLPEGLEALASGAADEAAVAITFDDGFMNVLTHAAPILDRHGVPYTVFVIGQHLEGAPVDSPYMDRAALGQLASSPYAAVGAHGFTHRPLTRLGSDALAEELNRSRDAVCSALGRPTLLMSYPYGAVDDRVVAAVHDAGFAVGATSTIGINRRVTDPLLLRRTEILASDGLEHFAGKVRGHYDWYGIRQRLYWPVPNDAL